MVLGQQPVGELGAGSHGEGSFASEPQRVQAREPLVRLAAGGLVSCGLTRAGKAFCRGSDSDDRVGPGRPGGPVDVPAAVAPDPTFREIRASGWTTCALDRDGGAYCWGQGVDGRMGDSSREAGVVTTPTRIDFDQAFQSLAPDESMACGTTTDGALHCWGILT